MTPVFVDTSYLLALVISNDKDHELALRSQPPPSTPLLSTEYILLEVLDGLSALAFREIGLTIVKLLRANPMVQIVAASTTLLDEGIEHFERRRDKDWGITDCISFSVMQRHGIHEALTADHHFEQAGFIALLR